MLKLKPALEERVTEKVRSGSFSSADELIETTLDAYEQQERDRESIQRAIAEGQAQLDRGEYVSAEESRRRTRDIIDRYRPPE